MAEGDRFPSPKLGNGPGEFATEAELEAARKAIMWSRLRGQVGEAEQARLAFLESQGYDGVYDSNLLSEFTSPGASSSSQASLKERFPSPVFGNGPGEYSSVEEYEAAKKAVYWARQQAAALGEGDRFPSPKLGNGPGEFASEEELEAAKKAILWSRLQGQVGHAAKDRLKFLLASGADKNYDKDLLSDFGRLAGSDLSWSDVLTRFPSPVFGTGPGEYATVEEYDAARKAILWARSAALGLQEGERFPSPKLGTGPGEFATEAELEAAKRAIMWSRLRGQVGEAEQERLKFLRDNPNMNDYDAAFLSDFSDLGKKDKSTLWTEAYLRFPSPTLGLGPGEFASLEEFEAARKAIHWAREAYINSSGAERFYEPKLGLGPGEFASVEELEAARRAIKWSMQQGHVDDPHHERLMFENSAGADLHYDGALGGLWGAGGSDALMLDPRERFPSPVLGLGAGEYGSLEELEAAKRAVYWARENWDPDQPDRFPSPKLGVGPGEYATVEELEAAQRAIMWARQQGQIGMAQLERLSFERQRGEGADELYDVYHSDFDQDHMKQSPMFEDARARFPSPKLGVGPGEYATMEELERAQKLIAWQRAQYIAQIAGQERFVDPEVTVGPGDYKSEAQLENESKEAYWARLRALEEIDRYYSVGIERFDWWD